MRDLLLGLALAGCGGGAPPAATTEPTPIPAAPAPPVAAEIAAELGAMSPEQRTAILVKLGEYVYRTGGGSGVACTTCHQENGEGLPPAFPPLVGQAKWMGTCEDSAKMLIEGKMGEIVVNDITYNSVMPPQPTLTDLEIAAVTTYVRSSWGNDYGTCLPEHAAAARPE